jgi:hypothetical protein
MRFWLDRGVDGFRLTSRIATSRSAALRASPGHVRVPSRMREVTDAYPDRAMVGEVQDRPGSRRISATGRWAPHDVRSRKQRCLAVGEHRERRDLDRR